MLPNKQNKIKRIVFIAIAVLTLIAFVIPLAVGGFQISLSDVS